MKVYNTLSGRKEEFLPHDPVRMYVCGVTPYDSCHLGHAMSYMIFDAVRRYLEYRGYTVRHVQNFTDIDDKIINRAAERRVKPSELAEGFIESYFEDMDSLNINRAHIYPLATEEVPAIIEVVSGLIEKGHAYRARGDVYFRVGSFPGYGKLGHRSLDEMMPGARIEVGDVKEGPLDFALWKAAKPGEPSWESPWRAGRPGWHIECSAMSLKYLGETLDIHGGGQDLIFPHHENEKAQSEAYTGISPFVRCWMHNGLMQLGGDKMSKSSGVLITVKEALSKFSADALRLLMLSSHYRSPVTYSEATMEAMERGVDRLRAVLRGGGDEDGAGECGAASYREQFIEAMDDDFNTAQAQAVLFDLAGEINRCREKGLGAAGLRSALRELAGVLGLTLDEDVGGIPIELSTVQVWTEETEEVRQKASAVIDKAVDFRNGLRARRMWNEADAVRGVLAGEGIRLEDTQQDTLVRYLKKYIEAQNIYDAMASEFVYFQGDKGPQPAGEGEELLRTWNEFRQAWEEYRRFWQDYRDKQRRG
ncbi:cysteine--tRNA ligase [Chloroflexota bacterium]